VSSFRFSRNRDYRGGTDADHVPVIPGNVFPPDPGHQDESLPQGPVLGGADMGQTPFVPQPES
jgi:hypothetical protein